MMLSTKSLGVFSLLAGLVCSSPVAQERAAAAAAAAPSATIASGVVIGTTTQYPDATATANKFLGIPYAKSPPLRFGLPEPAAPWQSPIQAVQNKPICFQQTSNSSAAGNQTESEDCLYANVFTPAGTTPSSAKAVLLWVFGGNLQTGDATEPLYDGSLLAANHDVIVVTFNYRINVFGFSNAPEIPVSQQNAGFYDQRFMLQWTRQNIAAFGGDPSKITLFGWSAGGQSIRNLVAFPPSPQVFRGAILQSEATIILGNGTQNWNALAAALNCPTGTGSLACVRAAKATDIRDIIISQNLGFPQTPDGITFADEAGIEARFTNKQAAQVPLLIGSNGQELSVIPYILGLNGAPLVKFIQALEAFLPLFGNRLSNETQKALATNVVFDLTTQFFTQAVFQCPAAQLADWAVSSSSSPPAPVWRYYFNASFPNQQLFPGSGAYHGIEIGSVFGTYPRAGATAQQAELSTYVRTAWSNFAKDPANGPGWPQYNGSNKASRPVGNIGSNGNTGEQTVPASQVDTLCGLFDLFGGIFKVLDDANPKAPESQAVQAQLAQAPEFPRVAAAGGF